MTLRRNIFLAIVLSVLGAGSASSQIYDGPFPGLPRRQDVSAEDYRVTQDGAYVHDLNITVTGSVIIEADDVTLENVAITPKNRSTHAGNGLVASGVNRLRVSNVDVYAAGASGILLQGGEGHSIVETTVRQCGGSGLVLDGVSRSDFIGLSLVNNGSGLALVNSSGHNRLVGIVARGFTSGVGFFISADSDRNQVIRSRPWGSAVCDSPDTLWHHSLCDACDGSGACACHFSQAGMSPEDVGDPADFHPRSWTVCKDDYSFADDHCDGPTLEEVQGVAAAGDLVLIDTHPGAGWPPLTIDKPVWLVGNNRAQKGQYGFEPTLQGLTVTAQGARLQNLYINGPIDYPMESTTVINVRVKVGADHWVNLENRWAEPPQPGPPFIRGFVNGDAEIDISDVVAVLFHLFSTSTLDCREAADVDDDDRLDIADPIYLLLFLFTEGSAPLAPFGACGPDPTPADPPLGCERSAACAD